MLPIKESKTSSHSWQLYFSKFLLATVEVCESLCHLISIKADLACNTSYQDLYDWDKAVIKIDLSKKFYDVRKPLYLETDVSGIGLSAGPLQV